MRRADEQSVVLLRRTKDETSAVDEMSPAHKAIAAGGIIHPCVKHFLAFADQLII